MSEFPHPHLDKLRAALKNAKCPAGDRKVLREAEARYHQWIADLDALKSIGKQRVQDMVSLLNGYKDALEVELIAKRGSNFVKRQKGQLKLDNSVIEEFCPRLVVPEVVRGLAHTRFWAGPQQTFMSLAFAPADFEDLGRRPNVLLKVKDQDFAIGSTVYYMFAADPDFEAEATAKGRFSLAVLSAEIKVNLDKTMFQEAAGTAARLKQGCPVARYFILAEYLDMTPEDCRLTAIDNVYLLRKARRLPFDKRGDAAQIAALHRNFPISADVIWQFTRQIQTFVDAIWYKPDDALSRGSFV